MVTSSILLLFILPVFACADPEVFKEVSFKFQFEDFHIYGFAKEFQRKNTHWLKIVSIQQIDVFNYIKKSKKNKFDYPKKHGSYDLSPKTMADECLSYASDSKILYIRNTTDNLQKMIFEGPSRSEEVRVIRVKPSEDQTTLEIKFSREMKAQYCQYTMTLKNDEYIGNAIVVADPEEAPYFIIRDVRSVKNDVIKNVNLKKFLDEFEISCVGYSAMTEISLEIIHSTPSEAEWKPINLFETKLLSEFVFRYLEPMMVDYRILSGSSNNATYVTAKATLYKNTEDKIGLLDAPQGMYLEFTMNLFTESGAERPLIEYGPSELLQLFIDGSWWTVNKTRNLRGCHSRFRAKLQYWILKTTLGDKEVFGIVKISPSNISLPEKGLEIQVTNGVLDLTTINDVLRRTTPEELISKQKDSAIAVVETVDMLKKFDLNWSSIYIRNFLSNFEENSAILIYVEPMAVSVTVMVVKDFDGPVTDRMKTSLGATIKKYLTKLDNAPELDVASWPGEIVFEWTEKTHPNFDEVLGEDAPIHLFVGIESNPGNWRRFVGKRPFLGTKQQILGSVVQGNKVCFVIDGNAKYVVEAIINELNRQISIVEAAVWHKFDSDGKEVKLKKSSEWENCLKNNNKHKFHFARSSFTGNLPISWIRIEIDSFKFPSSEQRKKNKEKIEAIVIPYRYVLRKV